MKGAKSGDGKRLQTQSGSLAQTAMTALMRYQRLSREFRFAAGTGFSPELFDAAGRDLVFVLGEERGLVGLVGARRESIYVKNTLSEPRWIPYIPTLRSAYFTPVLAEDELLGVFILFSETVDAFSVHERALADLHAHEVARLWRVAGLVNTLEQHIEGTCACEHGSGARACSVVVGLKRLTQTDGLSIPSTASGAQSALDLSHVSPRELEVIGALRRGLRLSQIARSLGISTHTARNHLKRVYRKLGVHSQVELLSLMADGGRSTDSDFAVEMGLRVLYVDGDLDTAERLKLALETATPPAAVSLARDLARAKAMLAGSAPPYDVLLTVMSLVDGSGLELVAEVRARALPLPVVVLTGPSPSEQLVSVLKAGADDYLVTAADDDLTRVPAALQAALARFRAEMVRAARPLRVLYAEGNAADADSAVRHMQRHAAHICMTIVHSGEEVLALLPHAATEPSDYDVLLLDYRLPGTGAFDLLKAVRDQRKLDIAVVLITGYSDGNAAAQAFHFGATECLVKYPGHLSALPAILQGAHHCVVLARERQALHKQEQALRESEARFRVMFEQVGVGVALVETTRGILVRANERYCDVFGCVHDDIVGRELASLLHPEDLPLHQANMDALRSGDLREFTADRRCVRKDGSPIWVRFTISSMASAGELQEHCIAVVQDTTDHKLIETAQQLLSADIGHLTGHAFFHELALRAAQLLGVELGFVGKLLPTTAPRIRMLGLSVDGQARVGVEYELSNTPCEQAVHRRPAVFPQNVTRLFPTAHTLRTFGVTGYVGVPLTDASQRIIGVIGVMSRKPLQRADRMEMLLRLFAVRTAAEMERQRTDAQFSDLFEHLPDGVIIVNSAGLISLANREAERLFGYARPELIGMPVELLIPEAERMGHVERRQRFQAGEEPRPMGSVGRRLRAQRKDGSILPVDIWLNRMRSDDGVLVVAAVRDVSARERTTLER